MPTLRLATFNALSARRLDGGRVDLTAFADAIASLDTDVLALQEVDRLQPRSLLSDQAALAAQALGAMYFRYVDLVHGTPGEPGWVAGRGAGGAHDRPPHDGPSYGIALISRRPVHAWHVLHLDPAPGWFPIPVGIRPPRVLWIQDEPRAVIAAELSDPAVVVACTHLSFAPFVNARQLRKSRSWLDALPGQGSILMGDLNLPGRLAQRISGWRPLATAATFPAPAPRLQLDHVLASPDVDLAWHEAQVRRLPVSDHRAIVVDIALR